MEVLNTEVRGRKFKVSKIDALKQFHVARRISPLLKDALPAMKEMQGLERQEGGFDALPEAEKLDKIAKVMGPFIDGMSKLSDADAELVLFSLLSCAEVQQPDFKTWMKVANDKQIMAQDLDLPTLLQVAGRSFMHNLSNFFQGPQP